MRRIHGGARLASDVANLGYAARRALAAEAERRIAARGAELVPNRSSLFSSIGTTTEKVARALVGHDDLPVVTNNVHVVAILLPVPGIELAVAGGSVHKADGGMVGEAAVQLVCRYRLDYAVIEASAIDLDGTLLDFEEREVDVARAVVAHAGRVVLVADATEFARSAPLKITGLERVRTFVTDRPPPAASLAFRSCEIDARVARAGGTR